MTRRLWAGNQNCLEKGSVVYFVANEETDGTGELITHVGRIKRRYSNMAQETLPAVRVLLGVADLEPDPPQEVRCAVSDLFTGEQVREEIIADGGPLTFDHRDVGELVLDRPTNLQLAEVLGAAALRRQMEQLTHGPEAL